MRKRGEICLSASRIKFEARREGKWKLGSVFSKGERQREENVFEVVSRAVARKRRGVSRRWPNITQRSLFRAGGEAGARNRNDLEQHRAGPPCSSEPCPPRHFRLSTTSFPFRFSIAHELASRRIAGFYYGHAGRSTSREVLPPFLTAARRARLVPRESMHLGAHQGRTSLLHHLSLSLLTVASSKFIPPPPPLLPAE